ncbi:MAG TPA: type I phosphomannose isomerase catalytic subunit [Candidatus Angelobacter sp.]|nr:type I phosphomannose isomerase catalytic subunit [Candidatus Angelobacter sp.]
MADLYPLLLYPEFSERVWGTRDLSPIYNRPVTGEPIGEAWLTGDNCKVANGPLAGLPLGTVCKKFGAQFLGEPVSDRSRFPLLIKFLFPKDKLSVQVHPDDEGAARIGQPCGKTECWYVLQADPGAVIALGLKPGTTKAEVELAIRENRMEKLLNWIEVQQGDLIYVDAGTVHAIGPGSVIVETQQNSDTTYRLYDYGRPRELHIRDGLQAVKEQTHAGKVLRMQPQSQEGKTQVNLVASPSFIVDKFKLTQPWEFRRPKHAAGSVWCLVAIGGIAVITAEGIEPIVFSCGEVVVIPASVQKFTLKPQWEVEFLCSSLPTEKLEHPQTVLLETPAGTAH